MEPGESNLHIKQVNLILSKGIGILYKLRHLPPKKTLKTLYSSIIQSHIIYGIINWGCTNKSSLEPLKSSLRKAVTVIDFAHYMAHSEPVCERSKIFSFDTFYILETANIMFEINKSPDKLSLQQQDKKLTYV